jgi:hypothetical protein
VTAPTGDPAYNVNTWKLGYQTRQFGQGSDPLPTGVTVNSNAGHDVMPSVCAALATPPTHMSASAALALPPAPATTFPATISPEE